MTKINTNKCPIDKVPMQRAKIKVNYNGTVVETEGYRCPKCGDEWLTIPQAKKSRQKLVRKAQATITKTK